MTATSSATVSILPDASAAAEGLRAFFQDLHRAFDATLRYHAGRDVLSDALMAQAVDSFDGNVAIQCADEPPLGCQRGCATCCTLRVTATAPEVWLVARFLRAVAPRLEARGIDLWGLVAEADAHTRGLGEVGRVTQRQRCAFIASGACVIYAVRPLACRGHASHDVNACTEAAAGQRFDVPVSVGHRRVRALVQNAMQSALREAGLAWGSYELNHALMLARAQPDAEAAWLAGGDPLAAAAVDEVPADEMAAIFDQLKPVAVAAVTH
jgi:Fe-S-cluster containining protein